MLELTKDIVTEQEPGPGPAQHWEQTLQLPGPHPSLLCDSVTHYQPSSLTHRLHSQLAAPPVTQVTGPTLTGIQAVEYAITAISIYQMD